MTKRLCNNTAGKPPHRPALPVAQDVYKIMGKQNKMKRMMRWNITLHISFNRLCFLMMPYLACGQNFGDGWIPHDITLVSAARMWLRVHWPPSSPSQTINAFCFAAHHWYVFSPLVFALFLMTWSREIFFKKLQQLNNILETIIHLSFFTVLDSIIQYPLSMAKRKNQSKAEKTMFCPTEP